MRGLRGAIALSLIAAVGCASGSGEVRPPRELPQPSTVNQCVQLASRKARKFSTRPGYRQFEVSVLDPTSSPPTMLEHDAFLLSGRAVLLAADFAEYVPSAPASVAILIDASENAEDKVDQERDFAGALIRNLGPGDDAALMVYSRRAYLLQPMTSDSGGPLRMLPLVRASGNAALYDAAAQGINAAFKLACYARRSLVIIGSGYDNASHITSGDLIDDARDQGVAIYFVGIGISDSPRDEREKAALKVVTRIVEASGGQILPVGEGLDRASVDSIARAILANMRGQYVVGFSATGPDTETPAIEIEGHPEYLVVSKQVGDGAGSTPALAPLRIYHSPQYRGVLLPER